MLIIGCDFHSGFQQIAIFDNQTGEFQERKLLHPEEAAKFYRSQQEPMRVGIEAGAPCQWFRRLLEECGHQLWVGDAAKIRAAEPRKQKTDRRDAELILKLLVEERFPRIWMPSEQERDVRQLLMDRHHRVRARTQVKNQLQSLALNQGLQKGKKLWSEAGREQLRELPMMEHAARRLMTHPGVGPQTALATVLTLGEVSRFESAKQVASYLGLIPGEYSSGNKQRLGHISKQGSSLMRFLLVEAGQTAARNDAQLRRAYARLVAKKCRAVAKVMGKRGVMAV